MQAEHKCIFYTDIRLPDIINIYDEKNHAKILHIFYRFLFYFFVIN